MVKPTQNDLRNLFSYDPDDGTVRWKIAHGRWGRIPAGTVAGWKGTDGGLYLDIGSQRFPLTHVIWVLVYGKWPLNEIDHKDCDRANNRIKNLREATRSQNLRNKRAGVNGRLYKGASLHRKTGLWRGRIRINGHEICLGYFKTQELAHNAYKEAAQEFYGEFARFK